MDSSDEEICVLALLWIKLQKTEKKVKRKWVHNICKRRAIHGEYHTLFPELRKDSKKFFQYFRMSYEKFQELLNLIKIDLNKENTPFRRSITPEERLAVCLRFLTTGDSFKSIALSYRLGHTTVREIVHETCAIIWIRLSPLVMPAPTTETWKSIESVFSQRWNFPNCIGALDGKHIVIEAPAKTGSLFYNYKSTFSIVLMALVDADYRFIAVDVGAYGKNSDGGIYANSDFGISINEGTFNVPDDKPLPGSDEALPHVIVGDEAFPLRRNIMRPFPRSTIGGDDKKLIFNYRLSRARRVSENAFGLLTQIFRIYQRRIKMSAEHVDKVVLATCCLHNFLRNEALDNLENRGENIDSLTSGIRNRGGNSSTESMAIRDKFMNYFVSLAGSVGWQTEVVRRGRINN